MQFIQTEFVFLNSLSYFYVSLALNDYLGINLDNDNKDSGLDIF